MNQFRLGAMRRDRRDYSVKQRVAGLNAGDRLAELAWQSRSTQLLVCAQALQAQGSQGRHLQQMRQLGLLAGYCALSLRTPSLVVTQPIARFTVNVETYNDDETDAMYGFTKVDLRRLLDVLHIPPSFLINAGRHAFHVDGTHAFLYMLYRYRSPSVRMTLDSLRFGFDYSVLSKMFKQVVQWMHDQFSHLLRGFQSVAGRLSEFNAVIVDKIRASFDVVPEDAEFCALFGDGCRLRVCRPHGEYWVQRAYYSGHKHYHNHAAQGIFSPDGVAL